MIAVSIGLFSAIGRSFYAKPRLPRGAMGSSKVVGIDQNSITERGEDTATSTQSLGHSVASAHEDNRSIAVINSGETP